MILIFPPQDHLKNISGCVLHHDYYKVNSAGNERTYEFSLCLCLCPSLAVPSEVLIAIIQYSATWSRPPLHHFHLDGLFVTYLSLSHSNHHHTGTGVSGGEERKKERRSVGWRELRATARSWSWSWSQPACTLCCMGNSCIEEETEEFNIYNPTTLQPPLLFSISLYFSYFSHSS